MKESGCGWRGYQEGGPIHVQRDACIMGWAGRTGMLHGSGTWHVACMSGCCGCMHGRQPHKPAWQPPHQLRSHLSEQPVLCGGSPHTSSAHTSVDSPSSAGVVPTPAPLTPQWTARPLRGGPHTSSPHAAVEKPTLCGQWQVGGGQGSGLEAVPASAMHEQQHATQPVSCGRGRDALHLGRHA
eukprot:360003-Chlamydomonas_euryale.AAC.5